MATSNCYFTLAMQKLQQSKRWTLNDSQNTRNQNNRSHNIAHTINNIIAITTLEKTRCGYNIGCNNKLLITMMA